MCLSHPIMCGGNAGAGEDDGGVVSGSLAALFFLCILVPPSHLSII